MAVVRGSRNAWEEVFGWADKENTRAAIANTPYLLGSVWKPITATAVMVLRERGLVDLDRPINDYLFPILRPAPLPKVSDSPGRMERQ